MQFHLKWTPRARQEYQALQNDPSKAEKNKKVQRALGYLQTNVRHPSLNAHEFKSWPHPWDPSQKVFEAYVENITPGAYRIFWCYGPGRGQATILAVIPHP